ncbi:hypothetical protein F442_03295 [Phytophthora nicotianae P10297]|uniref:Phospholipase/carboxylesterase/thioesterase domain-containing protein n=3 Tax=Phytophthora nicotianae TaxID=4792 RepID=W2ZXA1_PHYNI|nr:hypothetical protein L916_03211 [Phytophthora nicotianae]ETP51591.1 hypothetical protein F442_03295 [Phytophthora nicotianae P10297]
MPVELLVETVNQNAPNVAIICIIKARDATLDNASLVSKDCINSSLLRIRFVSFRQFAMNLSALLHLLLLALVSSSCSSTMVVDKQNTVVYNSEKPSAVVFFLHGLGDTAHGWADMFRGVAEDMPHVKFVLPTAKPRPVTIANGREIPAWYDIEAFVGGAGYAAGIDQTRDALESMIAQEVKAGIPRSRIVVGGFSQGGAVSYFTGFQTKQPIGGIMVLSSFIPREKEFQFAPETADVPLLICHGNADSRARYEWALKSKQRLTDAGVKDITFHTYPNMDHTSSPQEIKDIRAWLGRVLPAISSKQEL